VFAKRRHHDAAQAATGSNFWFPDTASLDKLGRAADLLLSEPQAF
jgi:hypothetical protein